MISILHGIQEHLKQQCLLIDVSYISSDCTLDYIYQYQYLLVNYVEDTDNNYGIRLRIEDGCVVPDQRPFNRFDLSDPQVLSKLSEFINDWVDGIERDL